MLRNSSLVFCHWQNTNRTVQIHQDLLWNGWRQQATGGFVLPSVSYSCWASSEQWPKRGTGTSRQGSSVTCSSQRHPNL